MSMAAATPATTSGELPIGDISSEALAEALAEALCPKCSAPRKPDATSCATCGLASARMAAYRDARDAAVAEPVRAAWQHVSAAWADDAKHDQLFQLAASHNAYAWAAGRYRTRGRDPIAVRQLERLRKAAEATLLATATVRADATSRPYRGTAGVLITLVVVVAAGLLYAVIIRGRHTAALRATSSPNWVEPAAPLPPGAPLSSSGPAGATPGAGSSSGGPGTLGPHGVRPLVPGHPVSSSTIH
jgi:hypothetical protein